MDHEEVKRQLLVDPETRDAYEHLPLQLAVARVVVEQRRVKGMSQEDLAEALGTSQNQIWRIESGDANITLKTLQRLSEVLGFRFVPIDAEAAPASVRPRSLAHSL